MMSRAGLLLSAAVCCMAAACRADPAVIGTYVDTKGINWGAQPPTPIVDVRQTAYTHVYAAFFLPSLNKTTDFAYVVTNPDPAYGGPLFVNQTHKAGKKIILTVGGATELPTTPAYFTTNDPTQLAHTLAAVVTSIGLDGVDIDYEDDYSNGNPGLTGYGDTRAPGSGPAVDWLVTLTKTLRQLLPKEKGYIISHAPQAPYFDLGYDKVYQQISDDIDWFNVQFYNQCPGCYETYDTLIVKETINVPKSCVKVWDGSLTDIVKKHNVPEEKIVLGKIVAQGDGNNGFIAPSDLAQDIAKALSPFPKLRGAFGWQWGSDTSGAWSQAISGAFGNSTAAA